MNKNRKYFKMIVFACILALVLAISASSMVAAKKNTKPKKARVTIKNFRFAPQTIRKKGPVKVTWVNKDNASHTITADDGSFDSGIITDGETYPYTFTKKGTYSYHCENHPTMKGKVVVR